MSPSEVIIEVYIMPEDASSGALFSFQSKDPFLLWQGWRKSLPTLPFFVTSWPGYTAWLLCVLTGEQQEGAGGGGSISNRFLSTLGPPSQPGFSLQGLNPSTPSLVPRVPLSHS